jgi:hypothetical protein
MQASRCDRGGRATTAASVCIPDKLRDDDAFTVRCHSFSTRAAETWDAAPDVSCARRESLHHLLTPGSPPVALDL